MSQLSTASNSEEASAIATPAPALQEAWPARLSAHMETTKPRITRMVVITAAMGFGIGAASHAWDWLTLVAALLGTALSCMGSSVLNQHAERDTDALMHRTRNRPLPSGRLRASESLAFGIALCLAGVLVLGFGANLLAATVSAFTIISYTLIYTPLKRVTFWSTYIGALPGAMPPVIGYAAVAGTLDAPAWPAFLILLVWQIPHFWAIAWLYREDYARGGLPMLPVIDPEGRRTFRQTLISCVLLLAVGVLPYPMGLVGIVYLIIASLAGLAFLGFAIALWLKPSQQRARGVFFASLVYLPLVLGTLMVDLLV